MKTPAQVSSLEARLQDPVESPRPDQDHDPLRIAPRPSDIAATGLSEGFVAELTTKHLYQGGIQDLMQLADRLALPGSVLEPIVAFLRHRAWVQVLPAQAHGAVRYELTERGRQAALEALVKSGYVGAAPVTLEVYRRMVKAQSVGLVKVTRDDAFRAFGDVIAHQKLIDRLGVAVNSGRPIFLYGPAGTGKTYLGTRLVRMLADDILVPHAILVGDAVLQFFNPTIHQRVGRKPVPPLMLDEGYDLRFVRCRRPEVVAGGELTLEMLEVEYDSGNNQYYAPQQLMANNGLYMIDDLGRQRVTPDAFLNRWIVPMEEGHDFLTIGAGQRFRVPFDVILIFSTNFNPLELADEAFLRRLGHKVRFRYVNAAQYEAIWRRVCSDLGLEFDAGTLAHVFELYKLENRPLLPCHPRDLLTSVVDELGYQDAQREDGVTLEQIESAWKSYFVPLDEEPEHSREVKQS